ncbi:hypothetical protein [Saccharopolyspora pogona]|uniref:hypothetical protein n=1 Tax=Saccharopolyspora pogona TaxID=333966 RepID=UPI0016840D1B|nr:hypothetical protein [Saccharopolyspora pogona]
MIPEWLFGPAGDLRPLPPMEMDVVNAIDRFGGIHTAISGGRTVDVLGYKARYGFELNHIEPDEYAHLEAVFTRQIPGNTYLIDPLRKNLLSREASSSKPSGTSTAGVFTTSGSATWIRVLDGPVSWSQRAAQWSGMLAGTRLHLDYQGRIPVVQARDMTFSVYVRSAEAVTVTGFSQPYLNGTWLGTRSYTAAATLVPNTWTRIQITVPGDVSVSDELHFGIQYEGGGSVGVTIQVASAQAEFSSEPTEPVIGGGSIRAGIETMETVSPYYPYQSVILKILEV